MPEPVLIVPLPDKVIPLLEFNVKLPVVSKVPPFKVNLSASDVLGFPRLLSALILILPAFIWTIPV